MKYVALAIAVFMSVAFNTKVAAQDSSLLKSRKFEMTYFLVSGSSHEEFGTLSTEIVTEDNKVSIYNTMHPVASGADWTDTCISNSTTLAPIYHSSSVPNCAFELHYGESITGYYLDKKTGKNTPVNDSAKGTFIDEQFLSLYLTTLPLAPGYKKSIDCYSYNPDNISHIKKYTVSEVKNNLYTSQLTGSHPVWQVSVTKAESPDVYIYYIDKKTRRVWKLEMMLSGQNLVAIDKESDYNPFKSKFDKDEAVKMVSSGSATIDGQAYARDNAAAIKGIAIFNINKKQCAPAGTLVVLIPYTDFFKEWFALNDAARKNGRSVPLPTEAAACIKTTTVYDNEGNFEFTNLMKGDYMLLTQFGYAHQISRTEVTGYTDTYIDGAYVGSTTNTAVRNYNVNSAADVKKIVTIKKDGETITIKLKKTR